MANLTVSYQSQGHRLCFSHALPNDIQDKEHDALAEQRVIQKMRELKVAIEDALRRGVYRFSIGQKEHINVSYEDKAEHDFRMSLEDLAPASTKKVSSAVVREVVKVHKRIIFSEKNPVTLDIFIFFSPNDDAHRFN